jgi:hypothetical protein
MSHYTNRYNFWRDNKQTIILVDPKYSSYREFENSYFKNETNFYIFFNLMRDRFNFGQDLKTLYSIFACDFDWAKKTVFCGGTSNSTNNGNTTNVFACLLKDPDLKLQKDVLIYTNPDNKNDKWYFFTNYRYFQTKTALKGTWSCNGSDSYIIKLDDGRVYDFKTNNWTEKTTNTNNNTNTNTTVNTNLTANDLASGSTVKVGMRGDIVTKIQELLIAKGFIHVSKNDKADGIFGNRTKRMVMAFQAANGLNDEGVVGKDTWAKLNDGSATGNNSTNQTNNTKDPFEVPGSDSSIMQESRKKILRKYLQEFK